MKAEAHVDVPCLSIVRPATAAVVAEIRSKVRDFAAANGANARALAAVALAVDEAVSNVVQHAYAGTGGMVRVEADVEEDEIELVVADDGRGFVPGPAPGLGLGLALMREGAIAFQVRDRPLGGVEVWIRFPLAA